MDLTQLAKIRKATGKSYIKTKKGITVGAKGVVAPGAGRGLGPRFAPSTPQDQAAATDVDYVYPEAGGIPLWGKALAGLVVVGALVGGYRLFRR